MGANSGQHTWTHSDAISPLDLQYKGLKMGQQILKSFGQYSKSRAQKRGPGADGGKKSIFSMLTYRTLFLFVIIELFPNSVFQLYYPKDYYKQKQWNPLLVTMITEIMNINRLLWWLPWH